MVSPPIQEHLPDSSARPAQERPPVAPTPLPATVPDDESIPGPERDLPLELERGQAVALGDAARDDLAAELHLHALGGRSDHELLQRERSRPAIKLTRAPGSLCGEKFLAPHRSR